MARPEPPQRSGATTWLVNLVLLAIIVVGLWGLAPLFDSIVWWVLPLLLAIVVLAAAGTVRSFTERRIWPTVAAAGTALVGMTLAFASPTALLGFVPTLDTVAVFRQLMADGGRDIGGQAIPAQATEGILYLVCLGVVIVAVAADACAHLLRMPALAGLPLLVLLLVPGVVRGELVNAGILAVAAAGWLVLVVVSARPPTARTAVGVGAAAIVTALVVPLMLPAAQAPTSPAGGGPGTLAAGLNPIITLGDDLRRGTAVVALTYQNSDDSPQYLRLTVLDDFSGQSWEPATTPEQGNNVDEIGPVPGLGDTVPTSPLTTEVTVANVLSRWLPVPYAAEQIRGLDGRWYWEPDGLTVRTTRSNAQGQEYEVDSVTPLPSVEQLIASGGGAIEGMERFTQVPSELPAIVAQTAAGLVQGRASNYERALALQEYFRSGEFTYSEAAQVEQGFDGSGAEVLGTFLQVKTGYCVHFASAMAAMARTLDIPARVVVGFTPGTAATTGEINDSVTYRVTTHNLHAWPELYFDGIGWVRFEPTPGRGTPPAFAPRDVDDPTTPDVDESVPPAVTPEPESEPGAAPSATPNLPDESTDGSTDGDGEGTLEGTSRSIPWSGVIALLLVMLLISPAVIRSLRRARRLTEVRRGSALAGWDELRDTADDLGLANDATLTPRQLVDELTPLLDEQSLAALGRVRTALESQVFSRETAAPVVGDVRRVITGLRRGAGGLRAVVATVAPRSLLRRWRGGVLP